MFYILNLNNNQDRKNCRALKTMQEKGIEIKINHRLQSRLFIGYQLLNDDFYGGILIIGSFDFNREGLAGERRDAGIITTHPDLIKSAITFFKELWETEY